MANVIVRDVCVCGQKYRIRRPEPGYTFGCPKCGREIVITASDIELADPLDEAVSMAAPPAEHMGVAAEAILLEDDSIRPAARNARVGAVDRMRFNSDEATLASGGRSTPLAGYEHDDDRVIRLTADPNRLPPDRSFSADLMASFYFAGLHSNAVTLGVTTLAVSLFWLLTAIPVFGWFLIPIACLSIVYVVQFLWSLTKLTADDEDEIPIIESDWSFFSDAIVPMFWMLLITVLCNLPAWIVAAAPLPLAPQQATVLYWVLWGLGFSLWPVMVMSVAIGDSIFYLRPDWVWRCIAAMGPAYLMPMSIALGMRYAWNVFNDFDASAYLRQHVPLGTLGFLVDLVWIVAWVGVNLYFGYVLFRTLGLMYRHYRSRFPWRV